MVRGEQSASFFRRGEKARRASGLGHRRNRNDGCLRPETKELKGAADVGDVAGSDVAYGGQVFPRVCKEGVVAVDRDLPD